MRDYGKVPSSDWSDPKFIAMSDDGRMLRLYLKTCPHGTIAGVFRLPDGYVSDDLHWAAERVAQAFDELFRNGYANRCPVTKWVSVVGHFSENQLANPNQTKAAAKVALQIPHDCTWRPGWLRLFGPMLGIDPGPMANGSETVAESVSISLAVPEAAATAASEAESATETEAPPGSADFALTSGAAPKSKVTRNDRFDAARIELPDWLDRELWSDWVLERKAKGKAITERGAREQLNTLAEYREAGHTPERVIRHAIGSGNQGLFPPPVVKPTPTQRGGRSPQSFEDIDYSESTP